MKNFLKKKYKENQMLRWDSDAFESQEISEKIYLDIKTKLETIPHPYCGWRSIPNQKYETISINKHGLRSPDIDIENEKNYCLFFGGSVAWGFGASKNENIPSYQIEKNLKLNNYNFNVINLAQNSMNSHDELKSFISSVDEIKPKMIISLSGINDIWQLRKDYNKTCNLHEQPIHFFQWGQTMGIPNEKSYLKNLLN